MAPNVGENRAGALGGNALDNGQVPFLRAAGRELRRQGLVCSVVLGNDQAA